MNYLVKLFFLLLYNIFNNNKDTIIYRKRRYELFVLLKAVSKRINKKNSGLIKSILIYPPIVDKNKLAEIVNKVAWGLPNKINELTVYVPVTTELISKDLSDLSVPSFQRNYLKNGDLSHIVLIEKNDMGSIGIDNVLLYDSKNVFSLDILLRLYKTEIIDEKFYYFTEVRNWKKVYYQTFNTNEHQEFENKSKKVFSDMLLGNQHKEKAYCFLSGPSLSKYKDYVYEINSFKVVCKDVVKKKDLMEYIQPDLIVFSDYADCLGWSEYAADFREYVLKVVEMYKCYVAIPLKSYPLMLYHYPELKPYLLGMPYGKNLNIPDIDKFWTKHGFNIITNLMLPIASSVSDEIYIIGADGRKPDQSNLWDHEKNINQGDELKKTLILSHPSKFRDQVSEEYYDYHCRFLEQFIIYGEEKGKEYYTITPSNIPVLSNRYVDSIKVKSIDN